MEWRRPDYAAYSPRPLWHLHAGEAVVATMERTARAVDGRPAQWAATVRGRTIGQPYDGIDAAMMAVGRVLGVPAVGNIAEG